jgi:hypothetical protein
LEFAKLASLLGQRQSVLDETLTYPVLAPSGAKPLRWQQAVLGETLTLPASRGFISRQCLKINKKAIQKTDGIFIDWWWVRSWNLI